ncbi:MAG TPA: BamA/TamA family outer membrane protein [Polyangiaceae bacterium LLY-WYZ-15_(1-7)]|nr:BamA/TamA family outer membrane protein [Polyangiaceae bacterium LLY-WYZ-15_(1-7)]
MLLAAAALALLGACAHIPEDRYGVDRLRFEGTEEMDHRALRACLATSARERFRINFGAGASPSCGQPPFDARNLQLGLWRWPWADWPVYDRNVFERDLQRIERWYRARGYYDAEVVSATFDPPVAAERDRVESDEGEALCEREDEGEGCRLRIAITVEEGEPVQTASLSLRGHEELDEDTRDALEGAWQLEVGERFDEAYYDRSKARMLRVLRDAAYGCAAVEGQVEVDPEARTAAVAVRVDPGPTCVLGDITVTGHEDLSERVIRASADLSPGDRYTDALLDEAQHFVYSLGAFASVEVVSRPRRDEEGACTGVVDVEIRVTPGRRLRYGVGGGVLAGTYTSGTQQQDVRQWDIHLLAFVEHRNFLGGLRRIRLEARPKLVFQPETNPFPPPRFGIDLRVLLRQPAFLERRTDLVGETRYDFGPDPNDRFFRHVLDSSLALQRTFWDGRFSASVGVHGNIFLVADEVQTTTSDFELLFADVRGQLDLRDNNRRPTKGLFLSLEMHTSLLDPDRKNIDTWRYVRLVPDVRAYAPLGGRLVLAGRFRLGIMHIWEVDPDLDPVSQALGPQLYRLRSGGASSHRGFLPGFLGDAPQATSDPDFPFRRNSGGTRRWEASLELRVAVSEDFGLVFFGDMGDVNRGVTFEGGELIRDPGFRFDHIRLAVGGGLRYDTIIGPVRFDIGVRVPGAQVLGEADPDSGTSVRLFGLPLNGAFHLTIGEAF